MSGRRRRLERGLCDSCGRSGAGTPSAGLTPEDGRVNAAVAEGLANGRRKAEGYDGLVLNSGGKDSLYMLLRLRRDFPDLRPLSVSIDNGFLNELSVHNIHRVCAHCRVDFRIVEPDRNIYRSIIGYGVRNSGAVGCYRVDCMDGAIFRDLATTLAAKERIPLIFCGHTAAQTRTILGIEDCTIAPEALARDRTDYFGIPVQTIFGAEAAHVWRGSRFEPHDIPRWVFPLEAWRPSQAEIERFVAAQAGFAPARVKQLDRKSTRLNSSH